MFGGGNNTNRSTVDRLDFSNDSVNASVRGPLTQVRMESCSFWKYSFGYFAGTSPGNVTTIERIDYSNDIATASLRGPSDR